MATLNNNWQELGSKNLYSIGSATIVIHIDGKLVSQSTENNTSSIQLRFRSTGYSWRTTNGTVAFTGEYTDSASCATYPDYIGDGDTIYTISKTITHNADGTKTFNIGGTISAYINSASRSATISQVGVTLPTIPRASTFSGGSGNIGGTTTITITRASSSFTHKLYYAFGSITKTLIASNVATSYVWTIPTSFYAQIPSAKSGTGTLYCETISNGTTIGTKTISFTATVTNSNPTFNVAYQDTNATTLAITNNNQQIIQNNSTLQFNITNASAKNSASLVNVKVTINGVTQTKSNTSATYNFNYGTVNVANNTNATVVVTDTRGFTTTKTVALTILGWQQPSAIISLGRDSNYYSSSYINVDANYSSLDSKNTITLKYRKKKTSASSWGSYTTLSDNVTKTFTADNLYEWNVQVVVQDLLATTTYNLTLPIGQPILFIDRNKRAVGVDCFPSGTNAFEVTGASVFNGNVNITGNGTITTGGVSANIFDGIIIEEGSNSSGNYIKWGSGLMICYKTISGSANISTAWGALYTSGEIGLGFFPATFTSRPTITVAPQTQTGTQFMLTGTSQGDYGNESWAGSVCMIRPNSRNSVAYIFDVIAIGRWK